MIFFKEINDRILYIIENKANKNKKQFAEMINVAPQVIQNIVSGRRNKPSFDILNAIISTFDDINSEWLITGNGEMFKNIDTITQTTTGNNNISIGKGNNNSVSSSTENNTIKQLQKELEDCKNQLEDYKKMLSEKDAQINKLLNILAK